MKIVKVNQSFYDLCKANHIDKELLFNELGRPCVLILNLNYKGKSRKFVVPMRSNISPTTANNQYFSLPPNKSTKSKHHHGIHYIKIFPIISEYIEKYHFEDNKYYNIIKKILDKNETAIITKCQNYLKQCEEGNKHYMTPDIDGIIGFLEKNEGKESLHGAIFDEAAITSEILD